MENPKYPSIEDWLNKLCCIHIMTNFCRHDKDWCIAIYKYWYHIFKTYYILYNFLLFFSNLVKLLSLLGLVFYLEREEDFYGLTALIVQRWTRQNISEIWKCIWILLKIEVLFSRSDLAGWGGLLKLPGDAEVTDQ